MSEPSDLACSTVEPGTDKITEALGYLCFDTDNCEFAVNAKYCEKVGLRRRCSTILQVGLALEICIDEFRTSQDRVLFQHGLYSAGYPVC